MNRVAVIVPARDAAAYLGRAISSIGAQTRVPDECIVVVGASSDDTLAIARRAPGVTVVVQDGDGLADARNLGISHTTAAFVTFLDADDEWLPHKTARQLDTLLARPEVGVVTGMMRRVDRDGVPIGSEEPALTPSGIMVRRSVLDDVGRFDTRFRIACDTAWLMRVRDAGAGPEILPDLVLHKGVRPDALSTDLARYRAEMLVVVRDAAARRAP